LLAAGIARAAAGRDKAEADQRKQGKIRRKRRRCEARKSGGQTIIYKYELTAEEDVPLTTLVNSLAVDSSVSGGIAVTKANREQQTLSAAGSSIAPHRAHFSLTASILVKS
jgi:hypothetical protein